MFRVMLFITYVIRIVSLLTLKTGAGGGDLVAKSLPQMPISSRTDKCMWYIRAMGCM